ncbi:gametocyte-specific factor 1-like [Dipodomys spectabilis]|uniref:gametocyte-specific factor 1-like n=1 Tax=Dipodomys spectabilis TaxID=105255 RepID=UPI001C53D042|nr:gametocyte-specific factor 1-like [Dipodomys spectabilis]
MEKEESVDPERLLQCPYDKNHKIRSCRFPYHLVKCKENHPDIAARLATSPFNARHLVPRDQLTEHIATCMDKTSLEDDIESLEDPSPSFVWGFTHHINHDSVNGSIFNCLLEHMEGRENPAGLTESMPMSIRVCAGQYQEEFYVETKFTEFKNN